MSITDWVALGGGALAVVGAVGTIVAYFSVSRSNNIIVLQAAELELTKGINTRLQGENKELVQRISSLEGQVKTLKDLVTQGPQIDSLATEMVNQHREVIEELRNITDALKELNEDPRDER